MKRDYIGYILAILSVIASFFISWHYYNKSRLYREPQYMTDTFPSTVFKLGGGPKLPFKVIRNDGTPLQTSVFLATHTFWNSGNQPILSTDVLRNVKIMVDDKDTTILSAQIEKVSRTVTDCAVNVDETSNKSFDLTFKVLEPGDGCNIKLFYTGTEYPKFKVIGDLIGVDKIKLTSETINDLIDKHEYKKKYLDYIPLAILYLAFSIMTILYFVKMKNMGSIRYVRCLFILVIVLQMTFIAKKLINNKWIITHNKPATASWVSPTTQKP